MTIAMVNYYICTIFVSPNVDTYDYFATIILFTMLSIRLFINCCSLGFSLIFS